MFSLFERTVATRYLRSRRQEGLISVIAAFSLLGITLGVATLLIVMAVMNGFHQELIGRILGLRGHMSVYPADSTSLDDFESVTAAASRLEEVVITSPIIEGQAMLVASGLAAGVAVRALRPEDFQQRPQLSGHLVAGSARDFVDNNLAIGWRIAQRFGIGVGDQVSLVSPQSRVTAFGRVLRQRNYSVGAIFDVGMYEYDHAVVFMPLAAAQKFFALPGTVSAVEIVIREPDRVLELREQLTQALAGRYRIADWKTQNSGLAGALQVERNVMFLILTLIILVAAFNVVSSLIMLVREKACDIAILRTVGATRGMIMRIFFLSGASIGTVGTLAGLILGVLFCWNIEEIRQLVQLATGAELFAAEIYYLSRLPAVIDWNEVVQLVVMSLTLSWGATLYPSWRAARLDPVEVLRYE